MILLISIPFIYIAFGLFLYHTAFWLFKKLMLRIDSFESYGYFKKAVFILGFIIGYIEDLLFNLLYGSPAHYFFNMADGFDHKDRIFWPDFTDVTWRHTKKLTLTYRIQAIIDLAPKNSKTYAEAARVAKKLNKYDPGHITGVWRLHE